MTAKPNRVLRGLKFNGEIGQGLHGVPNRDMDHEEALRIVGNVEARKLFVKASGGLYTHNPPYADDKEHDADTDLTPAEIEQERQKLLATVTSPPPSDSAEINNA